MLKAIIKFKEKKGAERLTRIPELTIPELPF